MSSKLWINLAKYGLGFGLLAWVVWANWEPNGPGTGLRAMLSREPNFGAFVVGFALLTLSVILTIFRWFILVRAQELPFTFVNALKLGLVGYYYNTFLPGSVGGDLLKAVFIAREQSRRTVAVATVVMDRLLGLLALVMLVALLGGVFWLAGFPLISENSALRMIISVALAVVSVSIVAWLLFGLLSDQRAGHLVKWVETWPKVGHSLAELGRAAWLYHRKPGTVAVVLVMSLVSHTGFVLAFHFAAQTFANPTTGTPALTEHAVIVPVGMAIQAFGLTPGGIGIGEAGFGGLYKLLNFPAAEGVMGALSQRSMTWVLGLIGYVVYLSMTARVVAAKEPAAAVAV